MPATQCFAQAERGEKVDSAVVRFAGDSGDGIQVLGDQFSLASAFAGNDIATFPDYPSEVRAPQGSTYGVSAYQIQFGGRDIKTIGDMADVLVAFNPAALKTNLEVLRPGGLIIVDLGGFTKRYLKKAGYESSPLDDGSLEGFRVLSIDITKNTMLAVAGLGLSKKDSQRCKNFWGLGLIFWLFHRNRTTTKAWLNKKFASKPDIAKANIAALDAGHVHGEAVEAAHELYSCDIPAAKMPSGQYRAVTGSEAAAWGLAAAAEVSERQLVFASYPITPASPILHSLAKLKDIGVVTYQAEDEIAAMCAAIGASYAGSLGATATSGPGMALKTEAIGLAVIAELPVVIVNSQRAGPSTGLPTKTEQSDLYQAVYGRNGDTPLPVVAARSPADCFDTALEASRLALKYMTPVIMLMDGFLGNAAEPWKLPDMDSLPRIPPEENSQGLYAHLRNAGTLARSWAVPGVAGLEHRIGGLERDFDTGDVSYDPENHQRMSKIREIKIHDIAYDVEELKVDQGERGADLCVIGWGSTYGPISRAVGNMLAEGLSVAHVHLRHLFPFAYNQNELTNGFKRILVPEMNMGQLVTLMRDKNCPPATGLSKVMGRPFTVGELEDAIKQQLGV